LRCVQKELTPALIVHTVRAMKIRDSGMPDEMLWESFFDAPGVLRRLDFALDAENVVDVGCGYGTFTVAAAQLTRGTVYAFDIDPQMVAATSDKARRLGLPNVRAVERDVLSDGTGLPDGSAAYVLLFNVLHAQDVSSLLEAAWRVLRPAGVVAVTHWIADPGTPRGPPLDIRPRPQSCRAWLRRAGFVQDDDPIPLPPHHFGLIARKPS
jgi:SAM-dependent methyltransferase